MQSIQSLFRPYLAPTGVIFALVLIHFLPGLHPYLVLTEDGLLAQAWRLLTTHLVHLNTYHLVTNILGLFLAAVVLRKYVFGRTMLNVMVFAGLFAALLPLAFSEQPVFVGFSGILHGLVAYAGIVMVKQGQKVGFAVLALLIAKLVLDMAGADTVDPWLNAQVAYLAHLGGALGGVIAVPSLQKRQPLQRS
ncbi:rhombosortase [Aliidiomarina sanyensis]|uniref:Rhombosortase n=1 Tax=Aliidiomarina sanyensis TaxID=1249555 RepID=A0A432WRI5_9GAMM|nr:rhombosortase [Aliidiomarina sanyensis]RUO36416.1 rhombosortase [Aliidiomarina sanyensis]